jgi:hypothetical protein
MKIDFITISAMEVSHYAPVVRVLRAMGHDAICAVQGSARTALLEGWDPPATITAVLQREQIPQLPTHEGTADIAITTHHIDLLSDYSCPKGRMMYGVGLIWPDDLSGGKHQVFDFHLVHGPLTEWLQFQYYSFPSVVLPLSRVRSIGYPRLDAYWHLKLRPHQGRFRVLYLPTWSDRSSLDTYTEAVAKLYGPAIDVRVKPHHGTWNHDPVRMKKLHGLMPVIAYAEPPELTYAWADVIIADIASGAFTEAILLRKPVVGLGEPSWPLLTPLPSRMYCPSPADLRRCVEEAQIADDTLRNLLFDTTEGHDAERAAKAILECAQ